MSRSASLWSYLTLPDRIDPLLYTSCSQPWIDFYCRSVSWSCEGPLAQGQCQVQSLALSSCSKKKKKSKEWMSEYMNVWIWSTVNSHLTTLVRSIWYHHPTGKEQFFRWPFILLMSKAPICVKGDPKGAGWKRASGTGHHLPKRKATGEVAHWKTEITEVSPRGRQAYPVMGGQPHSVQGAWAGRVRILSPEGKSRRLQGRWRRPWASRWWQHPPRSTRRATHCGLRPPWARNLGQGTSLPWTSASLMCKTG